MLPTQICKQRAVRISAALELLSAPPKPRAAVKKLQAKLAELKSQPPAKRSGTSEVRMGVCAHGCLCVFYLP